ncbi:LOW QUALITY PROTEIN: 5-hydroxytryptamine receptor 1D, partial [Galemys pyrenaicus]
NCRHFDSRGPSGPQDFSCYDPFHYHTGHSLFQHPVLATIFLIRKLHYLAIDSLAIMELLVFTLIISVTYKTTHTWSFGQILCDIWLFSDMTCCTTSNSVALLWTDMVISWSMLNTNRERSHGLSRLHLHLHPVILLVVADGSSGGTVRLPGEYISDLLDQLLHVWGLLYPVCIAHHPLWWLLETSKVWRAETRKMWHLCDCTELHPESTIFLWEASPHCPYHDRLCGGLCSLNPILHEGHPNTVGSSSFSTTLKYKLADSVLEYRRISAAGERKATKTPETVLGVSIVGWMLFFVASLLLPICWD